MDTENTTLYTPAQVAECFSLSPHDLGNWRRLPAEHPRCLQSVKIEGEHRYALPAILEWVRRPENALYREAALGALAPAPARHALGPGLYAPPLDPQPQHTEHEGATCD